jgi:hypothetical protein
MADKATASRFRSTGGTGKRGRPMLATTVSLETDAKLREYSERTGVPIGKVIDRAVALYLKGVVK